MEVFISEAEVDDAKIIIDYLKIISKESDNLSFGEDECNFNELEEMSIIQEYLNDDRSIMLLGFIEDELVSIGSLSTPSKKRYHHRSELGISVRKDYWHMGVASAMMEELIEFSLEKKIEVIELQVRSDNTNAIKLYQKYGFEKIGTYPKYMKINNINYDALLMNRYLK